MTDVMPATIPGDPPVNLTNRLVLVEDPVLGVVPVRWRLAHTRWKCNECGPMKHTDCEHTFSAGLLLAERLLGLTPTRRGLASKAILDQPTIPNDPTEMEK